MTREDTIKGITPTSQYLGKYVVQMINDMEDDDIFKRKPTILRKGDVVYCRDKSKPRPAVITKVCKEYVIAICLTTPENVHCMSESGSRFFREGCFCNSFEVIPIAFAFENWIGIYDNMKLLNNAIKELRQFIKKNI